MTTINYIVTTTGTANPVLLNDLGRLEISHPSAVNLTDIFDPSILAGSQSLQNAITSGHLVLTDNSGNQIQQVEDLQISVFSKTQTSLANSLIKYSGTDGKTVEQTNLTSDSTGLNLASGKYKIGGTPLRVENLDNVVLTNLQNGDILEYDSATNIWLNAQRKSSFQWTGFIDAGINATSYFQSMSDMSTQTFPFIAPYNCFIRAVTLSGQSLAQPYLLEVLVNGVVVTSYQRSGTSLSDFFNGLFVQISEGSSVSLIMVRQAVIVTRPYVTLYIREL